MRRISGLLGENLFDRAQLALGEIKNVEREIVSKTGERRSLLIHIKTVSIKGSTVLYACRDITELRHAREELRAAQIELAHASRLALVGELGALIAHEINQPLTSILANAIAGQRMLSSVPRPDEVPEVREIFKDIGDQSRRARDVIARIRALTSKRPLERQAIDVNEIAADMVRLIGKEATRRGVTLRTELGHSLPAIVADRVSLQQVMLNLMINAMDAMEQLEKERYVIVRTRRLDTAVEIAVSDIGHGIPADRLKTLFDAFFTTKKEGLGLGLAIARWIVEAHNGQIWAEDNGGRGATFRMTLPLAAAPSQPS
jgi:C4-dicarboxylate-specific signal transduction histidine kinase